MSSLEGSKDSGLMPDLLELGMPMIWHSLNRMRHMLLCFVHQFSRAQKMLLEEKVTLSDLGHSDWRSFRQLERKARASSILIPIEELLQDLSLLKPRMSPQLDVPVMSYLRCLTVRVRMVIRPRQ